MALDHKGIQEGLIQTINTLVGKDACPQRQKFTSPVIKARQQGTLPAFPLVVVDKLPVFSYGASGVAERYFNDSFFLVTETKYKLSYNITVYGSPTDDVQSIAQEIRDTFYRLYGRDLLRTNTGTGLLAVTDPTFTFNKLATDYEELSRITLTLSATDVFIEDDPTCPETGEIVRVINNGELDEIPEDPTPITVLSDVTAI